MRSTVIASALILGLSSSTAFSHGNATHPKKTRESDKIEQKEFGKAGDPGKVARTIRLTMTDKMRFTPSLVKVKQGETVKFIIANHGKITHEMVIGTMQDLKEHADLMKKFPDMEHEEPHMAHVDPGKTGEIVWTFNKPGEFSFGCLVAGHFEAGMTGSITVASK